MKKKRECLKENINIVEYAVTAFLDFLMVRRHKKKKGFLIQLSSMDIFLLYTLPVR